MRFSKAILRTPLFKVSSLSAASTMVRIITGMLMSKLVAVFVGPSGLALLGNLRNFGTSMENVVSLGFQNGIIKYVAEKKNAPEELRSFMSTVLKSMVFVSILFGALLFCVANKVNAFLFPQGYDYTIIIKALAITLPVYAVSVFLTAVVSGVGNFRYATYTSIVISIINLGISGVLIWNLKITGALISIVTGPIIVLLVNIWFFLKLFPISVLFQNGVDIAHLKRLSSYTVMAFVSLALGPFVLLAIRNRTIELSGLEAAGWWEGISRLSGFYMMFLASLLTIYYLPKLSAAKTDDQTKRLFFNYYKGVLPLFAVGLLFIYLLRNVVIQVLFTDDFLPMADLFFWQLIGDLLKTASLILAYNFFARRQTTAYLVSEILSLSCLFLASTFLLERFGISGIVMGHAVTYAVYFAGLLIFNARRIF